MPQLPFSVGPGRRALLSVALVCCTGLAAQEHPGAMSEGAGWWAYQPLRRPNVPVVAAGAAVANEIDRFVLHGLARRGLRPGPRADRAVLIRRLTYDLIGLPPTPEEVAAFDKDERPDAYERLVERLLDDPQYGVKWGRHWLDLVRYAETNSFERDGRKPAVWRYRDWVVKACNEDLPWQDFLTMQLAGDELPDAGFDARVATGYYRLGLWDDEPTDPLQAIYDDYDSILDTTARSMLGVSIGCARCHDHKKDPITTKDYYSLLAYIEHVKPYRPPQLGNRMSPDAYTAQVPVDGAMAAYEQRLAEFEERRGAVDAAARAALDAAYRRMSATDRVRHLASAASELVAAYRAEETSATEMLDHVGDRQGRITGQIVPVEGYRGTGLKFDGDDHAELPLLVSESFTIAFRVRSTQGGSGSDGDPRWFLGSGLVDGEVPGIVDDYGISWLGSGKVAAGTGNPETFIASSHSYADGNWHHVAFTRDQSSGRIALYVDGTLCEEKVGGKQPLTSPPRLLVGRMQPGHSGFRGELDELEFYGRALDADEVVALALDAAGGIAGALALRETDASGATAAVLDEFSRLQRPRLETVEVLCVLEKQGAPEPSHVRVRGNAAVLGEEVAPALPAVFGAESPHIVPTADGRTSGRRSALARWITADDNPLTWRVLANRLWQHHFGRGLSRTPNDFGALGERPTHPELLDWLATEVLARGGSLKAMHRLIVHSETYRRACFVDDENRAGDPLNDAFWRFDRRRLSAEEVRDSMLAVAGVLNLKMGGPSVYPPLPRAVLATASRPDEAWGRSSPEDSVRRSIYIHVKRSLLEPLLTSFDMADTDASCPVRFATIQPTQALTLLNGDFAQRRAADFAVRLVGERQGLAAQLERGLELVTCRPADAGAVRELMSLAEDLQLRFDRSEHEALQQCCLLLLNCNAFMFLD